MIPTAEADEPRFRDSYSLVYSFSLLFYLPALVLLGTQGFYSFSPVYLLLMVSPPLLGMLLAVRVGGPHLSWRMVLARSAFAGVGGMVVGGALFMSASMLLVFLGPAFEAHAFDALSIGVGVVFVLFGVPLAMTAWTRLRQRGALSKLEAIVCLIALVAVLLIGVLVLDGGHTLAQVMRKDQSSFLIGGVLWYLPSYALVGSIARIIGIV